MAAPSYPHKSLLRSLGRMSLRLGVRRRIVVFATCLGLFLVYHFFSNLEPSVPAPVNVPQRPGCPPLPGIEDVLVVMKTGVTEALEKVPIHFSTTLRCIPNYVIYSDFEEVISGVRVHDALRSVDKEVMQTIPDFQLYNRLRKLGREGLEAEDFADEANSATGKPNNPGWKLDKWKFLPMVREAYQYKNDAKWYVFMEADTYFSWPTLLAWLAHFNPAEPHYIGTETQIADVIFAHGGSGFIISNPAMERVSNEYTEREDELNRYTDGHWAGDCVLGKVLHTVGVPLYYSWPILQNSNVGELDEFTTAFYRQPWCFPAAAFHHLTPNDIQALHNFEQRRSHRSAFNVLLHRDIFKELIYPELSNVRDNWDNFSDNEHPSISSFHECKSLCQNDSECVQFSMRHGTCYTGKTPRLGISKSDTRSGWIIKKIETMVEAAPLCPQPDFGS